jgi:streptogramin lyase
VNNRAQFSAYFPWLVFNLLTIAAIFGSASIVAVPARADDTDLYVGLSGQSAIGLYSTTGTNEGLFVGNGSGGLDDTTNFKFGPDGNLYSGGVFNSSILEYNGTTGAFMRTLGSGLNGPFDVAFDNQGSVYVSNYSGNTVSQISLATGLVTRTYTGFSGPTGIVFNSNGSLLVTNFNSTTVAELNATTGTVTPFASGFSNAYGAGPRDLAFGPGGFLYVLDTGAGEIDQVQSNGSWSPFANISTQYPVSDRTTAQSLVYDNGNFYVVISADSDPGVAEYSGSSGDYIGSFPLPEANVDGIATEWTPPSPPSGTPEPGSLALMTGVAVIGLRVFVRRRRKQFNQGF